MTPSANNFTLLRLLAAWLVLFSHSYHLSGQGAREPLMQLTDGRMTLGTVAVGVFFTISGYLITGSAYARPELRSFLMARVRRIFPALMLVVLLTALVLGPLVTTLAPADYYRDGETWSYIARNITMWRLQYVLPGVFTANPHATAVNGALWTLPIEFSLYLAVGGSVWGLRRTVRQANVALPLCALAAACVLCWWKVLEGNVSGTLLLAPYFLLGAGYRLLRRRLPMRGTIAALLLAGWGASVLVPGPLLYVQGCVAISYATLWLGRHPAWVLPFNLEKIGDLSYGIYLFAFPVQQTVLMHGWAKTPAGVCLLASAIVLPLAWCCWHAVERHFVVMRTAATPLTDADASLRVRP
ncbi:acyltransferase family protein [Janthinobacterium sp. RT4P48]|uniref:acyltransferase family protein n=1 Tax=Janthinobacterium sp. RT4P48 TaxID=3424188 RepID=UPI003F228BEA